MKRSILAGMVSVIALSVPAWADVKIAHVYGKTGPFEAYAKQSHDGLMMGLEYATGGTMEVNGEKIVIIEKDTQLKPENGKALLAEAYGDDDVALAVGPVSSGVALAMLPVAAEYEKILIVHPAVADSITGENWNPYIFRTGRNSSQDAIAQAKAMAAPGVKIATLAQDYAFGRDGVAAFKEALAGTGAEIVHEEYAPTDTTDFTAAFQILRRIVEPPPPRVVNDSAFCADYKFVTRPGIVPQELPDRVFRPPHAVNIRGINEIHPSIERRRQNGETVFLGCRSVKLRK